MSRRRKLDADAEREFRVLYWRMQDLTPTKLRAQFGISPATYALYVKRARHAGRRTPFDSAGGRQKLTTRLVIEARGLYRDGYSMTALAERYDVHVSTIRSAVIGETWPDVPDPCLLRRRAKSLRTLAIYQAAA